MTRNIFGWSVMQILIVFVVLIWADDIFGYNYPTNCDFYWT